MGMKSAFLVRGMSGVHLALLHPLDRRMDTWQARHHMVHSFQYIWQPNSVSLGSVV